MHKNNFAVFIALITLTFSAISHASVSDSVVTVFADETPVGSAVAVTKSLLATNCRVAMSSANLQVKVSDILTPVSLFYADKEHNLCFLKDAGSDFDSVYIKPSKTISLDDVIYVIGNPEGYWRTNYKGSLTGRATVSGNPVLITNANISTQSSGGGAFDSSGNLIGITFIANYEGRRTVLVIPSEILIDYLSSHPQDR